jgi:hypothetical protein
VISGADFQNLPEGRPFIEAFANFVGERYGVEFAPDNLVAIRVTACGTDNNPVNFYFPFASVESDAGYRALTVTTDSGSLNVREMVVREGATMAMGYEREDAFTPVFTFTSLGTEVTNPGVDSTALTERIAAVTFSPYGDDWSLFGQTMLWDSADPALLILIRSAAEEYIEDARNRLEPTPAPVDQNTYPASLSQIEAGGGPNTDRNSLLDQVASQEARATLEYFLAAEETLLRGRGATVLEYSYHRDSSGGFQWIVQGKDANGLYLLPRDRATGVRRVDLQVYDYVRNPDGFDLEPLMPPEGVAAGRVRMAWSQRGWRVAILTDAAGGQTVAWYNMRSPNGPRWEDASGQEYTEFVNDGRVTVTPEPLPTTCGDFSFMQALAEKLVKEHEFSSVSEAVAQWVAEDKDMSGRLARARENNQDTLLGLPSMAYSHDGSGAGLNLEVFALGTYQVNVPAGKTAWGFEYPSHENATFLLAAVPYLEAGEINHTLVSLLINSGGDTPFVPWVSENVTKNGQKTITWVTPGEFEFGKIVWFNFFLYESPESIRRYFEQPSDPYARGGKGHFYDLFGPALNYFFDHREARGFDGSLPGTLGEQLAVIENHFGGKFFPLCWGAQRFAIITR